MDCFEGRKPMKYEVIFVTETRERYVIDSPSKEDAEKIATTRYI